MRSPAEKKKQNRFLADVQQFINGENLLMPGQRVICAVSGGVDSMTLMHSLIALGYEVEVAHFNFKLRGEESEQDEAFVRNQSENLGIKFHTQTIPEPGFWKKNEALNIQETARKLRYHWFDELKRSTGIDTVALGHHADDQAETLILNFLRGAGIAGLRGILPAREGYIRPLLPVSKKDIVAFARETFGYWREDASNAGDAYQRNKIRHQLWPVLEALSPGFERVLLRNAQRLRLTECVTENWFSEQKAKCLVAENEAKLVFDLSKIKDGPEATFFLTMLAETFGFSFDQGNEWDEAKNSTETKSWQNEDGPSAEIKAGILILWKKAPPPPFHPLQIAQLSENTHSIADYGMLQVQPMQAVPEWKFVPRTDCWLDQKKLDYPLIFRNFKPGDTICPLGMKGKQKLVSDILTEARLSLREKKIVPVLVDGAGELVWVAGICTSEKHKISGDCPLPVRLRWLWQTGI